MEWLQNLGPIQQAQEDVQYRNNSYSELKVYWICWLLSPEQPVAKPAAHAFYRGNNFS